MTPEAKELMGLLTEYAKVLRAVKTTLVEGGAFELARAQLLKSYDTFLTGMEAGFTRETDLIRDLKAIQAAAKNFKETCAKIDQLHTKIGHLARK